MRAIIMMVFILSVQISNVHGQTISHPPNSCEYKYDSTIRRSYYTNADIMPSFENGTKQLVETINKNLKWPGGYCDVAGTVFVAVIIEPDGRLTNKRILKGLNDTKGCNTDKEALRVVDFLTTWIPGDCGGKKVAVQYVIPVKFKMTGD